jgi:hypothetical protein
VEEVPVLTALLGFTGRKKLKLLGCNATIYPNAKKG